MKYEYKYVTLDLNEEQMQMVQMGLAKIELVNDMVLETINEEAKDGWEPLYPFSVPSVWLKKQIKTPVKKRATNS